MEDITNAIIEGLYTPSPDLIFDNSQYEGPTSGQVTVGMLRRHPKIREMLAHELAEFLIRKRKEEEKEEEKEEGKEEREATEEEKEEEEDPEYDELLKHLTDEQLVNMVNSDPITQATLIEVLLGTTDIEDEEGEPIYRPSIFNSNDVDELTEMERVFGGFREFKEEVPGKYDHLDEATLNMIYAYPECRKYLAKMSQKITPKMVRDLCGKIDSIRTN
jgi:hypothetical protein